MATPRIAFTSPPTLGPTIASRLGDELRKLGVSSVAIERAVATAHTQRRWLGDVLLEQRVTDERTLFRALAAQHELRFSEAEELLNLADPELTHLLSDRFTTHHRVLPIALKDHVVVVATSDPGLHLPDLATNLGARSLDVRLVTPTDFHRIRQAYALDQVGGATVKNDLLGRDLLASARDHDPELVALFDALLLDAIGERASDIHLERYGEQVRVRLRIDGDLHDVSHFRISAVQLVGIINVIKVNAGLDIAERRLPQGGRFTATAAACAYDLRVQTQPSLHGEHVVIRVLPHESSLLAMEDLGFAPPLARNFLRLLQSPQGLLLVVGPTGSGKSTTLYAALRALASDTTRKVISVEDPIEFAIEGVQQTQANKELGFGFSDAMRAFVRQDPDVVMVGEIRDQETALEAVRASQTGHLVLSTLHANDTVDVIQRLTDLGLHESSLSGELLGVLAQRLAKRLCVHCKRVCEANPSLLQEVFGDDVPAGFVTAEGVGCESCRNRGTRGRIAVHEFLPATAALRSAISRRLPIDELRRIGTDNGMLRMRERALELVQQQVIAFDEMSSMLPPERLRA